MTRYLEVVRRFARRIGPTPGFSAFYVPPSERGVVVGVLSSLIPDAIVAAPSAELWLKPPPMVIVADWPVDGPAAETAFRAMNDRREWLKRHGTRVILVLEPRAAVAFGKHAPDVNSVVRMGADIPFEPDPAVDVEAGREAMAAYLDASVGRLDLRGFFRSESEDVAFRVTEIYQALEGTLVDELAMGRKPERVEAILARDPRPHVVLGHPGSGKSFFLRWLALEASRASTFLGMERPMAVLVPLPTLRHGLDQRPLLDELEERVLELAPAAGHALRRLVEAGRVLFLLDGLDEVGDAFVREKTGARVVELAEAVAGCRVVATSRIVGYDEAKLGVGAIMLAPLSDEGVRELLVRWMRLYFEESRGRAASGEGAAEGRRAAADVLRNPAIKELARSPLLLTVLAVIHRSGVRLPDQRVELYDHATKVLVERWNRVRSPGTLTSPSVPLKAADAVRLLGPVAVELMQGGGRGVVSEDRLRALLDKELRTGSVRGIGSAQQAIDVFKRSLGLLVEQGPGAYAFLHLTFVEYFAAREIIRTGELEQLAGDPTRVFLPAWREVVLLAAGELGVLRSDDDRLRKLVESVAKSANRTVDETRFGSPAELLGGLLSDDPSLDEEAGAKLIDALVPRYWFNAGSTPVGVRSLSLFATGRWRSLFRSRLAQHYERWRPDLVDTAVRTSLVWVLPWFDVDNGYIVENMLDAKRAVSLAPTVGIGALHFEVSRRLLRRMAEGDVPPLALEVVVVGSAGASARRVRYPLATCVATDGGRSLYQMFRVPLDPEASGKAIVSDASLVLAN